MTGAQRAGDRSEQIANFIHTEKKVVLSGVPLESVVHIAIGEDGTICVLDNKSRLAHLFHSDGSFLANLGGHGRKPGDHTTPTDCAIGFDQSFVLSDFTDHRITTYDGTGKFRDSFVYTAQGFGATRVVTKAGPSGNEFMLFGNSWTTDFSGKTIPAQVDHFYGPAGKFIKSDFDFPPRFLPLGLEMDSDVAVSQGQDGNTYFALPFGNDVYVVGPDDQIRKAIERPASGFRAPKNPLVLDVKHFSDFFSWQLGWTPIVAVGASESYVFVEYQSFNPLRYSLDVWDKNSQRLVKTVHTNHLFLAADKSGALWFLDNLDTRQEKTYVLIEGRISLDPSEGRPTASNFR
jgi:hypothetical protein